MYCPACGNQLVIGTSFCSRCGYGSKERRDSKTGPISAFLTAITLIGVIGMGIMLGGALSLKRDGDFSQEFIGIFMLFTFLIVSMLEILLVRQLSRLTSAPPQLQLPSLPVDVPNEIGSASPRTLGEPVTSVTENTTRTLEYARREQLRR